MPSFDTPKPISVSLDIQMGSAHVIATDRTTTAVAINPTDPQSKIDVDTARKTTVDMIDGGLVVTTPRPRGIKSYVGRGDTGSVDITVELPTRSSIETRTGLGDIRADGRFADVVVKSGAGSVYIDEAADARLTSGAGSIVLNVSHGDVEADTAGDVSLGRVDGKAEIKNRNGRTVIGDVSGTLRVRSANGDIEAGLASSDVAVRTANGSVIFSELVSGKATFATGSGSIDVGIGVGTSAFVDAKTKFGKVSNSLESIRDADRTGDQVEIQARTPFGDIAIHRSPTTTPNRETG